MTIYIAETDPKFMSVKVIWKNCGIGAMLLQFSKIKFNEFRKHDIIDWSVNRALAAMKWLGRQNLNNFTLDVYFFLFQLNILILSAEAMMELASWFVPVRDCY